jgi:hypothetical protein
MPAAKKTGGADNLEAAVRYLAEQLEADPANAGRREQGSRMIALLDGTADTPAAAEPEPEPEPEAQ